MEETMIALSRGFGALLKIGETTELSKETLSIQDFAILMNCNVIVNLEDPRIVGHYSSDQRIHILPSYPARGRMSVSFNGIIFYHDLIENCRQQIVIVEEKFQDCERHKIVIQALIHGDIVGCAGPYIDTWFESMVAACTRPLPGPSATGFAVIVFDLDGVLVESKELHFEAFSQALLDVDPAYAMTKEEHDSVYCGLSTRQKLQKLTMDKDFPADKHDLVWYKKQKYTVSLVDRVVKKDERLCSVLNVLKRAGYPIVVASNCIRESVKSLLSAIGILDSVSLYISNEDVLSPKPEPEIYSIAAEHYGIPTRDMLVVEDSVHGKQAAVLSGAHLCPVSSPEEVTISILASHLSQKIIRPPILNIVVPLGGEESLLIPGSNTPKFLLKAGSKTLLQHFVDNIKPSCPHRFIFIARQYQVRRYNLRELCAAACSFCSVMVCEMPQQSKSSIDTILSHLGAIPDNEKVCVTNINTWPVFADLEADALSNIRADVTMTHFYSEGSYSFVTVENYNVTGLQVKVCSHGNAVTGYTFFESARLLIDLCHSAMDAFSRKKSGRLYIEDAVRAALDDDRRVVSFPIHTMPARSQNELLALQAYLESNRQQ